MYVEQPPGFEDFEKPNHVYKLQKALYGLKQAPRAWYERLSKFLVAQIYVDDIIFGATNQSLCEHFAKEMQSEFKMSMMGELTFFLGLQVKQCKDGIFINQSKYINYMLKKFGFEDVREIGTPMSPHHQAWQRWERKRCEPKAL